MKRLITILIFLNSTFLIGQDISYSTVGEMNKKNAEQVAELFMQMIQNKNFNELPKIFPEDEANINGDTFMPINSYLKMLTDIFKTFNLESWSIKSFSFDDLISSKELRGSVEQVHRVFNNHRILCEVDYIDKGKIYTGILVLRKDNEEWEVYSIADFGTKSIMVKSDGLEGKEHRNEQLDKIGINIPIPIEYSQRHEGKNQYFFDLKEGDITYAQFHIMYGPLQADIEFITNKFIGYAYKDRGTVSDLTIYLYPIGVLFEYLVTDFEGCQNKGYTMGIANQDKAIFIQYNATEAVYLDHWKEVDYTFRNIKKNL